MKQTMQKIAIALCMALAFAACKNDDPETGGGVESITIDKNELSLAVNGSETLKASINGVVSTEVKWGSSNKAVATVDDNGKVTAVGKGTAKITATAKADTTKTATCTVTVTKANITVTLDQSELTLGIGKDATLQAKINGVNSTEVTWKSSNDAVAAVDSNGKVTAKKEGTATITVTLTADKAKTATCTVTVEGANVVQPSGITVTPTSLNLKVGETGQITATIGNEDKLDPAHKKITWTSLKESVATVDGSGKVTAVSAGEAKITAKTTNGIDATCTVTVTEAITVTPNPDPDPTPDPDPSDKTISLTDIPLGYASLGKNYATTGGTTVTNRTDLLKAISKSGVIIIDGMIDMSEGKLLAADGKSTDSTSALDAFVKSKLNGKYQTYSAWVEAYSKACDLLTEDDIEYDKTKEPFSKNDKVQNSKLYQDVQELNKEYGKLIKLELGDNTTLIGKGPNCGIRGGTIQINDKKNIQIRNLTIQDAFDPFPHHEVNSAGNKTDGYNAQWDGINIQDSSENIWIDHCTFEDTLTLDYVQTNGSDKEKWQTYDGLCDMKNNSTNITISNCIFRNHDKTMLIGSSDSDGDNTKRFVTLQGNYFYNCGQRLPMVRNTTIHILNNYYDADSNKVYDQQYAVGCRQNSIIYAEANYFGSGVYYSFKDSYGTLHSSGNTDECQQKSKITSATDAKLFSSAVKAYTYTPVTAEQAKTNATASAGAGYTLK